MAEVFPSALQELLNEAGFAESFGNASLRSNMGTGPAKVRARSTRAIDKINCTINLQKSDYPTLVTFYKTTLSQGTKTFMYDHPMTGVSTEYRFTAPPSIAPKGGLWFTVNMQWEEML